jgi:hypothetical protein
LVALVGFGCGHTLGREHLPEFIVAQGEQG